MFRLCVCAISVHFQRGNPCWRVQDVQTAKAITEMELTNRVGSSNDHLTDSFILHHLTDSFILQLLLWNLRTKLGLNTTVIQSPHSVLFSLLLTIESL